MHWQDVSLGPQLCNLHWMTVGEAGGCSVRPRSPVDQAWSETTYQAQQSQLRKRKSSLSVDTSRVRRVGFNVRKIRSQKWGTETRTLGKSYLSQEWKDVGRRSEWSSEDEGWMRRNLTSIDESPTIILMIGIEYAPRQNMPLWHKDYFELKAMENQQMQEVFSALLSPA